MTIKQIEGYSIYMTKMLGKGSYGSVYTGRREQTSENVAVKILPKENSNFDPIQSITTITSRLPSRTRSRSYRSCTPRTSSCSTTSWRAPKTTTSFSNSATGTSPRTSNAAISATRRSQSTCFARSATASFPSSRKASSTGTPFHTQGPQTSQHHEERNTSQIRRLWVRQADGEQESNGGDDGRNSPLHVDLNPQGRQLHVQVRYLGPRVHLLRVASRRNSLDCQ